MYFLLSFRFYGIRRIFHYFLLKYYFQKKLLFTITLIKITLNYILFKITSNQIYSEIYKTNKD